MSLSTIPPSTTPIPSLSDPSDFILHTDPSQPKNSILFPPSQGNTCVFQSLPLQITSMGQQTVVYLFI